MADMLKFYKGNLASLPAAGASGALYVTVDEGAIYLGTGTSMKRLGDFIQVSDVASLPATGANTNALYYCVSENVLAKYDGSGWTQINKQPTAAELKTLLGLKALAYKDKVAYADIDTDLKTKIDDASAANHSHTNKTVLDGITSEKVSAWDAAETNAKTYADGLNKAMDARMTSAEDKLTTLTGADTVEGSVAKALKDAKAYTDTEVATAKSDIVGTASDTDTSATIAGAKKYADKLDAAMDARVDALETAIGEGGSVSAQIDAKIDLLDVTDTTVAGKYVSAVSEENGKISVTRADLPDYTDVYEPKGTAATEAGKVQTALNEEIIRAKAAEEAAKAAGDAAQSAAEAAQVDVDALEAKVGTVPADKTVVQMIADAQTAATYDDTALKARVKANEDAITVLNGDETKEGSVKKQVADAVAQIVADAPEAYDTLKEISDWISNHASDAATMNSQITTNKNDIAALEALVGTLPEGITATTVVGYIQEAIAGLKIGEYAKAADLTAAIARIATNEGDIGTLKTKVKALEDVGSQANVIETVKVNGVALSVVDKAVDVTVPTGALASKDKVAEDDLATTLSTKINGKAEQTALDALDTYIGDIPDGATATSVIAYVDEKVAAEGVAALKNRVTTAEGEIDTLQEQVAAINGDVSTAGSIAKAAADTLKSAKDYTDTLKNGEVKANADAIAVINGTGDGSFAKADATLKTQLEAYADTAESDAVTAAKAYTDSVLEWGSF